MYNSPHSIMDFRVTPFIFLLLLFLLIVPVKPVNLNFQLMHVTKQLNDSAAIKFICRHFK